MPISGPPLCAAVRFSPGGVTCPGVESSPADASADDPDVICLGPLLALRDVELDLLPFLQAAVAATGDRADVHEHVRAALDRDETAALAALEPLHSALRHLDLLGCGCGTRYGQGSARHDCLWPACHGTRRGCRPCGRPTARRLELPRPASDRGWSGHPGRRRVPRKHLVLNTRPTAGHEGSRCGGGTGDWRPERPDLCWHVWLPGLVRAALAGAVKVAFVIGEGGSPAPGSSARRVRELHATSGQLLVGFCMSSQLNSTGDSEPSLLASNVRLYRTRVTALCGGRTSIQRAAGLLPDGLVGDQRESHRLDPTAPGRVLIAHVDVDLVGGGDHFPFLMLFRDPRRRESRRRGDRTPRKP